MADLFLQEILEQPEALRSTLEHWLEREPIAARVREAPGASATRIVFTGMGSSLDAAYPAAVLLNERGLAVVAVETAELLYYLPALRQPDSLVIVVSQSGESAEPVRLFSELEPETAVWSVTNGLDNFVARHSRLALDLRAGQERTVATKTYVSTLFALVLLAEALAGAAPGASRSRFEETITAVEGLLAGWERKIAPLVEMARAVGHISIIGRGPSLATVHEAALILKEAGHRRTEGISGGHFRHGPLEIVSPENGYVLLSGAPRTRERIRRLAADIRNYGGRVVEVGPGGDVPLPELVPYLLPVAEIVPLELLAWSLARDEGRTVDRFERLTKVTRAE